MQEEQEQRDTQSWVTVTRGEAQAVAAAACCLCHCRPCCCCHQSKLLLLLLRDIPSTACPSRRSLRSCRSWRQSRTGRGGPRPRQSRRQPCRRSRTRGRGRAWPAVQTDIVMFVGGGGRQLRRVGIGLLPTRTTGDQSYMCTHPTQAFHQNTVPDGPASVSSWRRLPRVIKRCVPLSP